MNNRLEIESYDERLYNYKSLCPINLQESWQSLYFVLPSCCLWLISAHSNQFSIQTIWMDDNPISKWHSSLQCYSPKLSIYILAFRRLMHNSLICITSEFGTRFGKPSWHVQLAYHAEIGKTLLMIACSPTLMLTRYFSKRSKSKQNGQNGQSQMKQWVVLQVVWTHRHQHAPRFWWTLRHLPTKIRHYHTIPFMWSTGHCN